MKRIIAAALLAAGSVAVPMVAQAATYSQTYTVYADCDGAGYDPVYSSTRFASAATVQLQYEDEGCQTYIQL